MVSPEHADALVIFNAFVKNANAVGLAAITRRTAISRGAANSTEKGRSSSPRDPGGVDDPRADDPFLRATAQGIPSPARGAGEEVILLTKRKRKQPKAVVFQPSTDSNVITGHHPAATDELPSAPPRRLRRESTKQVEVNKVVPDVRSLKPPAPPAKERAEDGNIPAGELDRVLSEMGVLHRYDHHTQVRTRLDQLRKEYPTDLLLLRRIAEFYVKSEDGESAKDSLFLLASKLYNRGNEQGMRKSLEQVLVLDAGNAQATRLLGLLADKD